MGNLREIWTADVSTRKELLSQAAALLGGKSALGRRLGFRDGAFVGQMIRGERPITEKTMLALSRVNQGSRGRRGFRASFNLRIVRAGVRGSLAQ